MRATPVSITARMPGTVNDVSATFVESTTRRRPEGRNTRCCSSCESREYNGSTFVSSATAQITLSTAWQQVTVTYAPQVVGSTLDFTAHTSNAPPGNCFYADDASITVQ